jgi:hypothetical protein
MFFHLFFCVGAIIASEGAIKLMMRIRFTMPVPLL